MHMDRERGTGFLATDNTGRESSNALKGKTVKLEFSVTSMSFRNGEMRTFSCIRKLKQFMTSRPEMIKDILQGEGQ